MEFLAEAGYNNILHTVKDVPLTVDGGYAKGRHSS